MGFRALRVINEDVVAAASRFLTHPHRDMEIITYILEGALKFAIDGKEIVVRAGEVLCIPSNMPHEAWGLEDTLDLDVFTPPRADWLAKTDDYLRHGR